MPSACNEIIDDIEDLLSSQDIKPRESGRDSVTIRVKKLKRHIKRPSLLEENGTENNRFQLSSSVIPGIQTIYIKTWGCTHNNSDSEYMAGLLTTYGYKLTDDKTKADLWLLNSCTVKNPAEDHFRNEINAGRTAGKPVVVAGCVSQGAPKSPYLAGLSMIGVQQIDKVVHVVEETLKGNSVRILGPRKGGGAPLSMPKVRRNPLIEIVAISTGCLNQCTYCKTKHARGHLGSYQPEEIVERVKEAYSEGVVEVWMTSEDTGAYGRDIGTSLPKLLKAVIPVIPEGSRLRLGMTNPPYILEHLEEMSEILEHPRVYSFLHVPVQSGSDRVLADMKREYCREEFERIVDFLSEKIPGINVATDIICGFPTETGEDFEETVTLVQKYKFSSLFINQFYPRPGTPAAKMAKVPPPEVKKRTKRLTELFQSYDPYKGMEESVFEVLVTEEAHDKLHYVGHNKFYHQVLVPHNDDLMGKLVKVKIISTSRYSMLGEVLGSTEILNPHIHNFQTDKLSLLQHPLCIVFFLLLVRLFWAVMF